MSKYRIPLIVCVALAGAANSEFAAAAESFGIDYGTTYDSVGSSNFSSWEPYKSDYSYAASSAASERRSNRESWERTGKMYVRLLPFAVLWLISWWTNRGSKEPARRYTD